MKKNIGNQIHFDSKWWKKHKALTVKDQGLEKALVAFETETKDFGLETMTNAGYARAVAAVNAVGVAAKATLDGMGKLADTVAKGTKNHLVEYPEQIKKYKTYFKGWKDTYDQSLTRLKARYQSLLGEARGALLEVQQAEKDLKAAKIAVEDFVQNGQGDAKLKSTLAGKVNGLKSTFSDIHNAITATEKQAKDLDLQLPASFNVDTNSTLGKLTYDAVNSVHAAVKIGQLTLDKLASQVK